MYEAVDDPYCYDGADVLKNLLGIRDSRRLADFEAEISAQRSTEPLPAGDLDAAHYRAVHRHLFQDVYSWAGELRTVRMSKEASTFCYPEHIRGELDRLFQQLKLRDYLCGLSPDEFAAGAAWFLATLNAIHAFREGNGRTQLTFLALLAAWAGHPLDLNRLDPEAFLQAMIDSFFGDEKSLRRQIREMI